MDNKKKIAAGGAALLIGAAGYGVYATTLAVGDGTTSFAAGSATANQVEGFGEVTINAGTPTFDPKTKEYSFTDLEITPVKGADWKAVNGKTLTVVAYDVDGNEIGTATQKVDGSLDTKATDVPLPVFNANAVTTWGIVVQ
jgi:hypothetical protein